MTDKIFVCKGCEDWCELKLHNESVLDVQEPDTCPWSEENTKPKWVNKTDKEVE